MKKNRPQPKKMKIIEPTHKKKDRSLSAQKTAQITIRKKTSSLSKEKNKRDKNISHFNTNSNYTVDDDSKNHINLVHINDEKIHKKKLMIENYQKNYFTPKTKTTTYVKPNVSFTYVSKRLHSSSTKRISLTNEKEKINSSNIQINDIVNSNINTYENNVKKRNHSALLKRNLSKRDSKLIASSINVKQKKEKYSHSTSKVTNRPQSNLNMIKSDSKEKNNNKNNMPVNNININDNKDNHSNNSQTTIKLAIKSNWGNSSQISFFNIFLYDSQKNKIPILKSNIDTTKQYVAKYKKGEIKTISITYDNQNHLSKIAITNGYNDIGICHLEIFGQKLNLIWRGIIPKSNILKQHFINISPGTVVHSSSLNFDFIGNNHNYPSKTNRIVVNRNIKSAKSDLDLSVNAKSIHCNKVKLILISNYGNHNKIGMTGIEFIDENGKLIFSNCIKNIKTNNQLKEKFPVLNLINKKNETKNLKNMFLSEIYYPNNNQNANVSIDILFKGNVGIKSISLYNFNFENFLDCAVKEIKIIFYFDKKILFETTKLLLLKPPGENSIDYSQVITYPFEQINPLKNEKEEILKNFQKISKNHNFLCCFDYYLPILPCGFVIKIEFFSTWGDNNYIGMDSLKILDYKGNNICTHSKIFALPDKTNLKSESTPFYISNYVNRNKRDFSELKGGNRIIIISDSLLILFKVIIGNYTKHTDIGVKETKIFIDGNVIFEGKIPKGKESTICFNYQENGEEVINEDSETEKNNIPDEKIEFCDKNNVHIINIIPNNNTM